MSNNDPHYNLTWAVIPFNQLIHAIERAVVQALPAPCDLSMVSRSVLSQIAHNLADLERQNLIHFWDTCEDDDGIVVEFQYGFIAADGNVNPDWETVIVLFEDMSDLDYLNKFNYYDPGSDLDDDPQPQSDAVSNYDRAMGILS